MQILFRRRLNEPSWEVILVIRHRHFNIVFRSRVVSATIQTTTSVHAWLVQSQSGVNSQRIGGRGMLLVYWSDNVIDNHDYGRAPNAIARLLFSASYKFCTWKMRSFFSEGWVRLDRFFTMLWWYFINAHFRLTHLKCEFTYKTI